MFRRYLISLTAVLLTTPFTAAQILPSGTPTSSAPATLNAGEKQFDAVVQRFESLLKNCTRFTVDVTSRWTSRGGAQQAAGTNLFHIVSQTRGKLLIEAGSKETGPAQFICASDGRTVTRLYRPAKLYSQQPVSNLYKELEGDPMTVQMLGESGIDFLIRPDFRAHLVAQIRSLKDLGIETDGANKVHHFRLILADNRVLDTWFLVGDKPLLAKLVRTVSIPIDAQRTFQLTTTNVFKWEIDGPVPDSTFAVQIPADAKKVSDLFAALRNGDVAQLVGKMAPDFQLTDLQGKTVRLSDYRGRAPVVLIFWATWCAPSTESMPSLNDFLQIARRVGVAVFAINLGEPADKVRRFTAARGYQGTVLLDPKTQTLNTFRIGSIPVTILIGKDGKVNSYFLGSSPEVRSRIRQATQAMVGK